MSWRRPSRHQDMSCHAVAVTLCPGSRFDKEAEACSSFAATLVWPLPFYFDALSQSWLNGSPGANSEAPQV